MSPHDGHRQSSRVAEAETALEQMGLKQELKRNFSMTSMLGLAFAILNTWTALAASITTTVVTIIGYSAMAGLIGGGGLGRLAYNYGFQRYQTDVMIVTVVILVVMVQVIQMLGDYITQKIDHR